jgi:hypothetical protein
MKWLPLLILTACTHSQLTKPGRGVTIADVVPPGPYEDLGDVVVEQSWQFKNDEDDARSQARNYAARIPATGLPKSCERVYSAAGETGRPRIFAYRLRLPAYRRTGARRAYSSVRDHPWGDV